MDSGTLYILPTLSACPDPCLYFRLRCKALQQDLRTIETEAGHLDDQVYRLHILRAMARSAILYCFIAYIYFTQAMLHHGLLLHCRGAEQAAAARAPGECHQQRQPRQYEQLLVEEG